MAQLYCAGLKAAVVRAVPPVPAQRSALLPTLPGTQVGTGVPARVMILLLSELSSAVVPAPSLSFHQPIGAWLGGAPPPNSQAPISCVPSWIRALPPSSVGKRLAV